MKHGKFNVCRNLVDCMWRENKKLRKTPKLISSKSVPEHSSISHSTHYIIILKLRKRLNTNTAQCRTTLHTGQPSERHHTWWWFSLAAPEAGQRPAVSDAQWCRLLPSPDPPPSCAACRPCGALATTAWHAQPYHTAQSAGHVPYSPADLPSECPSPDP